MLHVGGGTIALPQRLRYERCVCHNHTHSHKHTYINRYLVTNSHTYIFTQAYHYYRTVAFYLQFRYYCGTPNYLFLLFKIIKVENECFACDDFVLEMLEEHKSKVDNIRGDCF